jgi:Rrf2 family protein
MLSQTAEYALRGVLYLAEHGGDRPVPVDRIAQNLGIPRNYLSKILHTLGKRNVLTSSRGPHGGFALAVPAERLSLLEVVEPFDELEASGECLLGRERCSEESPCAAHHRWKEVSENVSAFFRDTTVHELIRADALNGARRRARSEKKSG